MINPLGEDDVLDKIEDIRLRPSQYHQLFQEILSMYTRKERSKENRFDNIDQENSHPNGDPNNK